jgi:hypothetical protein
MMDREANAPLEPRLDAASEVFVIVRRILRIGRNARQSCPE